MDQLQEKIESRIDAINRRIPGLSHNSPANNYLRQLALALQSLQDMITGGCDAVQQAELNRVLDKCQFSDNVLAAPIQEAFKKANAFSKILGVDWMKNWAIEFTEEIDHSLWLQIQKTLIVSGLCAEKNEEGGYFYGIIFVFKGEDEQGEDEQKMRRFTLKEIVKVNGQTIEFGPIMAQLFGPNNENYFPDLIRVENAEGKEIMQILSGNAVFDPIATLNSTALLPYPDEECTRLMEKALTEFVNDPERKQPLGWKIETNCNDQTNMNFRARQAEQALKEAELANQQKDLAIANLREGRDRRIIADGKKADEALKEKDAEIAKAKNALDNVNRTIQQKDAEIAEAKTALDNAKHNVQQKDAALKEKDAEIAEAKNAHANAGDVIIIQNQKTEIDGLKRKLAWIQEVIQQPQQPQQPVEPLQQQPQQPQQPVEPVEPLQQQPQQPVEPVEPVEPVVPVVPVVIPQLSDQEVLQDQAEPNDDHQGDPPPSGYVCMLLPVADSQQHQQIEQSQQQQANSTTGKKRKGPPSSLERNDDDAPVVRNNKLSKRRQMAPRSRAKGVGGNKRGKSN
jgi:hypothetical protein